MPNAEPAKIRSLKDLQAIKEKVLNQTALRADGFKTCVTVHMGTCGIAAGARDVMSAVMDELTASKRRDVRLTTSGCIGVCVQEPCMTVETLNQPPVIYARLDAEKARLIFREHVLNGKPLTQYAIARGRD